MAADRVYMDHSATTPVREEVRDAMAPFFARDFGNASSLHEEGRRARSAVEEARETIALCIGAEPAEVYFTSGGTESDNLAIKGAVWALRDAASHVVTSTVEHHAVLRTCQYLEENGVPVSYVPVGGEGLVSVEAVQEHLRPDTGLVSVMAANNEVGTIQPTEEIGAMLRERGILFHVDAVQALGKVPLDVRRWHADLVSLSGHKIHAPKGVGILFVRAGTEMEKLCHGGHHERGLRAGTENVASAVGMARAVELAVAEQTDFAAKVSVLRDRLEHEILRLVPDVQRNGAPSQRLPNLTNLSVRYVEGEALVLSLDREGVAVATGSACTSGSSDPSHVLLAMGVEPALAQGSVRFSLGRGTTAADVDYVLSAFQAVVRRLRSVSPLTPQDLR
jgi:cysteine desulfurase